MDKNSAIQTFAAKYVSNHIKFGQQPDYVNNAVLSGMCITFIAIFGKDALDKAMEKAQKVIDQHFSEKSRIERELDILEGITKSDFYDRERKSVVWTWSIESKLTKGEKWVTLRSLTRKGFIDWDGDLEDKNGTVAITEKGYQFLDEKGLIDENGYFVK